MSEAKKAESIAKLEYLKSLANDHRFKTHVLGPLKIQKEVFLSILKDYTQDEANLRRAQGAIQVMDYFENAFVHAEKQLKNLMEKEHGKRDTNGTERNYAI